MNFKLTWGKSVVSVLVLIIINLLTSTTANCDKIACEWYSVRYIISALISALIIYIIWSLFQARAKKNLLTLREQIEDILRKSAVRTKSGISAQKFKTDDPLVEIFSRENRGRKRKKK